MKLLLQLLALILNALPKSKYKPIPLCQVYYRYGVPIPNLVGHVTAPSMTTGSASSITSSSFTMDGTISSTGGENVSVRGFCYVVGSGGTPTTSDSVVSQSGSYGTGSFSLPISGLAPGTTYSVRAYATNSGGTGYGSTVEVTTVANTPPTVVLNSSELFINQTSTNVVYVDSTSWDGRFQTFAGMGGYLESVAFDLSYSDVGTSFNTYVEIYAISGTYGSVAYPTGSPLATSEVITSPVQGVRGFYTYTFSGLNSILLESGVNYAALFRNTGSTRVNFYVGSTDIYSGNQGGYDNGAFTGSASNDTPMKIVFRPTLTTTTPNLEFTGTDAQSDDVRYNVQVDTSSGFDSQGGVVDSYSESNQDSTQAMTGGVSGVTGVAQSFTGTGSPITKVSFYLRKVGNPVGSMTASIAAHSGTFGTSSIPTEPTLAQSDTIASSTLSTSYQLVEFTFPTPYTTTNGTKYEAVLNCNPNSETDYVQAGFDSSSPTHSGNMAIQEVGFWAASSGNDLCFYVDGGVPELDKTSGTDTGFSGSPDNTDPFTSGQQVSYTVQSALSEGTYYWRVRGLDPSGTNTYGDWSETRSFNIKSPPTVVLDSPADASSGSDTTPELLFTGTDPTGDDIRYNVQIYQEDESQTTASAAGSTAGNRAYSQSFTANSSSALVAVDYYLRKKGSPVGTMQVKLYAATGTVGTDATPTGSALATSDAIDISTVSTTVEAIRFIFNSPYTMTASVGYCLVIGYFGGDTSIDSSNEIEVYRSLDSASHEGNPANTITYSDPDYSSWAGTAGNYDIAIVTYISILDKVSGTDSGYSGSPDNTDPYTSGQQVSYTVQSALDPGTYYWQVRGLDPSGSNSYGAWSDTRSFTINVASSTNGYKKAHTGSAWELKPVKYNIGGNWQTKPVKIWSVDRWIKTGEPPISPP